MIEVSHNEIIGVMTAWATRRNGIVKTTGIAFISDSILPTDLKLAALFGNHFDADFGVTPAAFGKVCTVNTRQKTARLFQMKDGQSYAVHCGNAITGAAAAFAVATGRQHCPLRIEHPSTPFFTTARVLPRGEIFSVRTTWHLDAKKIGIRGTVSPTGCRAQITGLNNYTVNVVNEFPPSAPEARTCGEKICFIERGGPLPRVKVASCGRWHGGIPDSAAVVLAIARQALPFMATVIPSGVIAHPGGIEPLPKCVWQNGFIHAEIHETDVEFTTPTFVP